MDNALLFFKVVIVFKGMTFSSHQLKVIEIFRDLGSPSKWKAKPQIKLQGIKKSNFGLNYIVLKMFSSKIMILITLTTTNFRISA